MEFHADLSVRLAAPRSFTSFDITKLLNSKPRRLHIMLA